jgi:hypothetical protein
MNPQAANAVMAISFFGAIAITAISIAAVWIRRIEARRDAIRHGAQFDAVSRGDVTDRLARIESAVEAISLEVERISEAQRFLTRLQAEKEPGRLPSTGRP